LHVAEAHLRADAAPVSRRLCEQGSGSRLFTGFESCIDDKGGAIHHALSGKFPPDALVMHTTDKQAFIAMTMGEFDERLTPEEMLRKQVGDQRLAMEESFKQAGYPAVTAVIPGQPAKRVALIVKDKQVFMFVAAVKGRGSLESEDNQFLSLIHSFRALTKAELKLAQPAVIHVVTVKPGETLESLARTADLPEDKTARIRLLNGLYPAGEVKPGDMLKLVR